MENELEKDVGQGGCHSAEEGYGELERNSPGIVTSRCIEMSGRGTYMDIEKELCNRNLLFLL